MNQTNHQAQGKTNSLLEKALENASRADSLAEQIKNIENLNSTPTPQSELSPLQKLFLL